MMKRLVLALSCLLWASTAFAQRDQIDLNSVVYHASLNVASWPITKGITSVEFKPGTPSQGDVGVRMTLSPYDARMHADSWPDFIMWAPNGDLRWTFWLFVKINNVWHGAAVHEMWKDRLWTGAPLLTQYRDWIYPNPGSPWGEMANYVPHEGDEVAFMATSGDLRLRKDRLTVNQRSNVVRVRLTSTATYTFANATQTAGDFDGDGKVDQTVYRPSTGAWYTRRSLDNLVSGVLWGVGSDSPVPCDYDGDGKTDQAVFRPSNGAWYLLLSRTGTSSTVVWGHAADIPAPADYDGDSRCDTAVFRPSNGTWYIRFATGQSRTLVWGTSGDVPTVGDFDADGRADVGVFRPSTVTFHLLFSSGPTTSIVWGLPDDLPFVADFDGDGRSDLALYRRSNGTWYIGYATGLYAAIPYGAADDVPVPGDYDGDGRADVGVYRPSTGMWYWISAAGGGSTQWGSPGDLALVKK